VKAIARRFGTWHRQETKVPKTFGEPAVQFFDSKWQREWWAICIPQ
jgi:hypothetical protein